MKLSKRELILLCLLLIIGLTFLEYRFVLSPGLTKLADLTEQEAKLVNELDTINFNLNVANALKKTMNENLDIIDTLSKPYLSGVSPDTLLLFTHQMLTKHSFTVTSYSPSPVGLSVLLPETAAVSELTYRIKIIAQEYQAAENGTVSTEEPTTPAETKATDQTADTAVEIYTLQVFASGTYDQINALLDDYDSLERKILISNINMTPNPVYINILDIDFQIEYFGIEKLVPAEDPLNNWTRETQPTSTGDPYLPIEPTEPTTTETSN